MERIIILMILAIFIITIAYLLYCEIKKYSYFKAGRNPYHRICRKCGAHQNRYQSNISGQNHITWWSEVYPIGTNPDCKCHSYSEDRE